MEMLFRRKFRKEIEAKNFELLFATNGLEALNIMKSRRDIDILMTDINMPTMDGLTLLLHINEVNPLIKSIVVSAYGDMENIRTAMNRGAFDFIMKPVNFEDLTLTIEKTLKQVQREKENLRAMEENQRLAEQLHIARQMQHTLLPQSIPVSDFLDVAAMYQSAMETGGDYYDFFRSENYDLGIAIADVAGKGTSAAFYMAQIKGVLHAFAQTCRSPKEILIQTNRVLYGTLARNSFITAMFGYFSLPERQFTFARAGHCPLVYYSAQNKSIEFLLPNGLGLAIDRGTLFEKNLEEQSIHFGPGDLFILFTDGICEATNDDMQEFGNDRFKETIVQHREASAGEIIVEVMSAINRFTENTPQHDDITMVAVKIKSV